MEKHEDSSRVLPLNWPYWAVTEGPENTSSDNGGPLPDPLSGVSSQEVAPWSGAGEVEKARSSGAHSSFQNDGSRAARLRSYLSEPFFDDRRAVVEPMFRTAKKGHGGIGYEWVMVGRAKSRKADAIVAIAWATWLMLLGSSIFNVGSTVVWLLMVVASVVIFPAFLSARDVKRRLPSITVMASHEEFPGVGFALKDKLDKSLRNTTAFSYSQKDYNELLNSVEEILPPTARISPRRLERSQGDRNVVESTVKGAPESVNLLPTVPMASDDGADASSSRAASPRRSVSSEDPRKALLGVLRSNASPRMKELARELSSLHSVMDELSPEQSVTLEDVTGEFLALVRERAALSKNPYPASEEELEHFNECVEALVTPLEWLRSGYLAGRRVSLESRRNYLAHKYPSSGDLTL